MNENDDLRDCLRALAEVMPREAGPSVQQRLVIRFRERHNHKRHWIYLVSMAASIAIAVGLYLAQSHKRSTTESASPAQVGQTFGFIALPYAESGVPMEQPVIVRVNISVSELSTVGVPVTPGGGKESVTADLLVGQDGVARAVRFVE